MPKRYDRLTDTTVLIAEERRQRPHDWSPDDRGLHVDDETEEAAADCPFCRGHERLTEQPRLALDEEGDELPVESAEWATRVVDNKYPVAEPQPESTESPVASAPPSPPFTQIDHARALHEVVIATPRHRTQLASLNAGEWQRIFRAWAHRFSEARARDFDDGSAFVNYGQKAGASLAHLHGQFLATDQVSPRTRTMTRALESYHQDHQACLLCERIDHLEAHRDRLIMSTDAAVSFAPFASRFPFEICVAPRRHQTALDSGQLHSAESSRGVASTLAATLKTLSGTLGDPPLNLMVQTAPLSGANERFHWHVVVLPALSRGAGFEWGTGWHVNPVAPETVASQLRDFDRTSEDG